MQAKQAPRHLAAEQRIAADRATAAGNWPALTIGRKNLLAVAQLHATAAVEPSAVLGVLTYWTSR